MDQINDGKHINEVIERAKCNRHKADNESPCWNIVHPITGTFRFAVCGPRIKAAGFTGSVSPFSLRLRAPGGRADTRSKRR